LSGRLARSVPMSWASSSGASHTPRCGRASSSALRACQTGSGTMRSPAGSCTVSAVSSAARRSRVQLSSTMLPCLMIRVCELSIGNGPFLAGVVLVGRDALLEGADAKAMHGVYEALVLAFTVVDIGFDQRADHVRNFRGGKRRADDVAEVGVI